jgi:hypothetical protein
MLNFNAYEVDNQSELDYRLMLARCAVLSPIPLKIPRHRITSSPHPEISASENCAVFEEAF